MCRLFQICSLLAGFEKIRTTGPQTSRRRGGRFLLGRDYWEKRDDKVCDQVHQGKVKSAEENTGEGSREGVKDGCGWIPLRVH